MRSQNFGLTCPSLGNLVFPASNPSNANLQNLNCTNLAGALGGFYFGDGDISSLIQTLADFGDSPTAGL
jgi:hypothetical protein